MTEVLDDVYVIERDRKAVHLDRFAPNKVLILTSYGRIDGRRERKVQHMCVKGI